MGEGDALQVRHNNIYLFSSFRLFLALMQSNISMVDVVS